MINLALFIDSYPPTSVDSGKEQQRQPWESIWKMVFTQTQAVILLEMSLIYNQR